LVSAPKNVVIVSCRWVYTLKYRPYGTVDQYKARVVVKSYTQTYGVNYYETFHQLLGWISSGFCFLLLSICRCPYSRVGCQKCLLVRWFEGEGIYGV